MGLLPNAEHSTPVVEWHPSNQPKTSASSKRGGSLNRKNKTSTQRENQRSIPCCNGCDPGDRSTAWLGWVAAVFVTYHSGDSEVRSSLTGIKIYTSISSVCQHTDATAVVHLYRQTICLFISTVKTICLFITRQKKTPPRKEE